MPECFTPDSNGRHRRLKLWLSILLVFTVLIGQSQTLTSEFVDAGYSIFDAGSVPGVPANYGGLTIRPEEPNTLYIGGSANNANAALYSIELVRDSETNQVTGFVGTAELVVATPDIDGGVLFAPNGTLMFTQYSQNGLGQVLTDDTYTTISLTQYGVTSSVGSLAFVPSGFSGAGNLIFASYNAGTMFNVPFTISETGEYMLSEQTATVSLEGTASGPEGIAYIPLGSDGFPNPSMVISSYLGGKVVAYDTDAIGLPIASTARDMITGLSGAEGALIDPVTGDFLFSTFGGGNRVIVMSGFENPNDCAGVPFGESILDECGECRLPDDPEFNSTCTDCAGELFGTAFLDECGICVGGTTGEEACVQDCAGIFGGSSMLDDCNVCDDIPENDNETCSDCAGIANGNAFIDDCGDCVGGTTGEEACEFDCPDLEADFGDICDDGNEFTENDVIGANCECAGEVIPQENTPLACADGIDNDGDGLSDCEDPECQALSAGCSTCFDDGSSFADEVIDYNNTCPNNIWIDPAAALGVPNFAADGSIAHASLGEGGHITLGFTDNTLINSGNDSPDLFVFEVGPLVEGSTIELRPLNEATETQLIDAGLVDSDEDGFYDFGAISGATAVVDIDSFFDDAPAGTLFFDAIKITDNPGGCSGSSPGADIDGVCALSSVPCAIGSACDDGNELTENDIISDDCECVGEPIAMASLLDLDCGGQVIQITDAVAGDNAGGTATSETRTVYAFAPDGGSSSPTYTGTAWPYVIVSGSILVDDNITAVLTVNPDGVLLVNGNPSYQYVGDAASTDANGTFGPWSYYLPDGTPSQDACPEIFDCPDLQANIGDDCDDGDAGTENDMVTADCLCEGFIIYDCPFLSLNIGDACDDGDDMTENDMVNANCNCEGTPIIVWDCPALEANIGDVCDDGDTGTENDMITADCLCEGSTIYDCPLLSLNIGDACNDGDDMTENDMVNASCTCEGTPIIVWDCPALEANIGDECDDGNDDLIPGIIDENCQCIEQFECPALGANISDDCDDGDEMTENDMVTENCMCEGTPIVVECIADGGAIEFAEGGTSYTVCVDDNEPSMVMLNVVEPANNDYETTWVITDGDGNLLGIPGSQENVEGVDFDDAGPGNCLIWVVNFDPEDSNLLELAEDFENGENVNASDLEGCYDLSNPAEVIRINCEPSECNDWVMYMNNNLGGVSDIYAVDISSGDAELTYITTVDYHAHIAYNPDDNLIYVIHNGNGSYVTVNPHSVVPEVSAPVFLSMDIPSITTATFAPNGKLLVGSMTEDIIYIVNVDNQMVLTFDTYSPINGGDIAFDSEGMLYLATRAGNGFYEVYPDDVLADQLIGTIPSLVTGMALTESEQMIMSHKANSDLLLRNLNGSDTGVSYPLMLDGEAYAHADGDMTSGCNTWQDENEGFCENFSTFYADINRPGISGTDLYSVVYTESGNADMTFLVNIPFATHIAYDAESDIVYLMNQDGSFVRAYNPTAGIFMGDLAVVGADVNTVAVVFNPEDGLLYVGSNSGSIKSIDLGTGIATDVATGPVSGGDLAIQDGKLYLATRTGSKLHEIVGGVAVEVGSIPQLVNGMAQANNTTDLIMANKNAGVFTSVNAADGSTVETFVPMIDGEAVILYDGDMAAGCLNGDSTEETGAEQTIDDNTEIEVIEINDVNFAGMSTISSYPNPTNGLSQLVFVTAETGRTIVEVYNISGRNVSTLYNQEAQAGTEYKLDFNGSELPNGVYIYKLTTNKETIMNKFMIAR